MKRELAHDERFPAHVAEGEIHLSVRVFEEAQGKDLADEPLDIGGFVLPLDPEEDEYPATDSAFLVARYHDGGFADALE